MSARDLLAFVRMHLATPAFAVMRRPQITLPDFGHRSSWGLGWDLPGYTGGVVVGHLGGNKGLSSYLRVMPERGVAIALLTNGGPSQAVFDDVIENLFSELAGVRRPEQPVPPAIAAPVDVERVAGTYRCAGEELHVAAGDNGRVVIRSADVPREFTALRDDALIAVDEPHTVFVLISKDERVRWLHFGRAARRV